MLNNQKSLCFLGLQSLAYLHLSKNGGDEKPTIYNYAIVVIPIDFNNVQVEKILYMMELITNLL